MKKKYAIIIGIDYHNVSSTNKLSSIDKDIKDIYDLCKNSLDIVDENILIITDMKIKNVECEVICLDYPYSDIIVGELTNFLDSISIERLNEETFERDEILIYMSCHGSLVRSTEVYNGVNNAIILTNNDKKKEYITSSMLFNILFGQDIDITHNGIGMLRSPFSFNILAIIDCCHSGNMLNLPFIYNGDEFIGDDSLINETYPITICISACDKRMITLSCKEGSPFTFYIKKLIRSGIKPLTSLNKKFNLKELATSIKNEGHFANIRPVISCNVNSDNVPIPLISPSRIRNIEK